MPTKSVTQRVGVLFFKLSPGPDVKGGNAGTGEVASMRLSRNPASHLCVRRMGWEDYEVIVPCGWEQKVEKGEEHIIHIRWRC